MEFLVRFEVSPPPSMTPTAVVGLWEAADATVLHEALASLPMFPWMDVTVEALATHPQEQK
jgi:muconolactone delta-isomerase